jgi:scyllo-inositol 2-dehydrogenase (NADP+)
MKQINVALCSFGMSGRVFHAPFLHAHPRFVLYGVWERTKSLAAQIYPTIKTFTTLQALLQDDAIDVVVVNTPSVTHFDYTQQVIAAGKHAIVEKPFTATQQQAKILIDQAEQKNKILTVYHNRRFDSDFLTVKNIINSGAIGEVKEVQINFDRYTPTLSAKPHKELPTPAVGIMYDLGSHLIDAALQLFGNPTHVFADVMTMRRNAVIDDYFEIILYYATFRVRLKATMFAREPQGYVVHGSLGSFIKSKSDVQEQQLQQGISPSENGYGMEPETEWGLLHTIQQGVTVRKTVPSVAGNYMQYFNGVYNAIVHNSRLPVNAVEAANVIAVIETAFKSHTNKRVLEFVGL